jgi:hypothetical protein
LSRDDVEDIEVPASKSGPALKAVLILPKISKTLVTYIEGLLAVSP